MIIIQPDGSFTVVPHGDGIDAISKAVNPPGYDSPFCSVPTPEGDASGFTVYANDEGLLHNPGDFPLNHKAMELCQHFHSPLVGPVCVTSFEESGETDCMPYVTTAGQRSFLARLRKVCPGATVDLGKSKAKA